VSALSRSRRIIVIIRGERGKSARVIGMYFCVYVYVYTWVLYLCVYIWIYVSSKRFRANLTLKSEMSLFKDIENWVTLFQDWFSFHSLEWDSIAKNLKSVLNPESCRDLVVDRGNRGHSLANNRRQRIYTVEHPRISRRPRSRNAYDFVVTNRHSRYFTATRLRCCWQTSFFAGYRSSATTIRNVLLLFTIVSERVVESTSLFLRLHFVRSAPPYRNMYNVLYYNTGRCSD